MIGSRKILVVCAAVAAAAIAAVVLPWPGGGWEELASVLPLRLPRAAFAALLGATLSSTGAAYQRVLQNPIADPYILGVASAASLALAIFGDLFPAQAGGWIELLVAVGAAALCTGLLLVWERRSGGGAELLVLFGLGLNFVLSSVLFLWLSVRQSQVGGGSLRWLFGRLPWALPSDVLSFALLAVPVIVLLLHWARRLDALALGDGVARTLAVDPRRTRAAVIFTCAIAVAAGVRTSGAIGFVGLVAPHISLRLLDPKTGRSWIAASAVFGAVFVVLCDAISRSLRPPIEFPIGIVTTIVGGPLFLWLLGRRR